MWKGKAHSFLIPDLICTYYVPNTHNYYNDHVIIKYVRWKETSKVFNGNQFFLRQTEGRVLASCLSSLKPIHICAGNTTPVCASSLSVRGAEGHPFVLPSVPLSKTEPGSALQDTVTGKSLYLRAALSHCVACASVSPSVKQQLCWLIFVNSIQPRGTWENELE